MNVIKGLACVLMSLALTIHTECVILIIDDDYDDQDLLEEALQEINVGIVCYKADNGQEGMKLLLSEGIQFPDLIFLDLNMPRVNGKQFLSQIKNNNQLKSIPVIVYSTSFDQLEFDELIKRGASYFLKKPVNYEELKRDLEPLLVRFNICHELKVSPEE